jgi:hypothetical protein
LHELALAKFPHEQLHRFFQDNSIIHDASVTGRVGQIRGDT